ncbi:hypothetical protein D3C76_1655320 [compost metagenome]
MVSTHSAGRLNRVRLLSPCSNRVKGTPSTLTLCKTNPSPSSTRGSLCSPLRRSREMAVTRVRGSCS